MLSVLVGKKKILIEIEIDPSWKGLSRNSLDMFGSSNIVQWRSYSRVSLSESM